VKVDEKGEEVSLHEAYSALRRQALLADDVDEALAR